MSHLKIFFQTWSDLVSKNCGRSLKNFRDGVNNLGIMEKEKKGSNRIK